MSLLESTMSMLESAVRKNGQSACMACSVARPSGCAASQAFTAAPKPYQPGSITRHCAQLNTQGMARRSSMPCFLERDAGRLPILRVAISSRTVDSRK